MQGLSANMVVPCPLGVLPFNNNDNMHSSEWMSTSVNHMHGFAFPEPARLLIAVTSRYSPKDENC